MKRRAFIWACVGAVLVMSIAIPHAIVPDHAVAQGRSRSRRATRRPSIRDAGVVSTSAACPDGMIHIPEGTFEMGSANVRFTASRPTHRTTLSSYCIDRTEVTVGAYMACVTAGACATLRDFVRAERLGIRLEREVPVGDVNWFEARAYCEWRGGDLPTEAQWEYAARGSDGRIYPWGNDDPEEEMLHWGGCGPCTGGVSLVGRYPGDVSPFGVRDMGGNVSEWVRDWWGAYGSESVVDPTGPTRGDEHVDRGGNYAFDDLTMLTTFDRRRGAPDVRFPSLGFRCAHASHPGSSPVP